MFNCCGSKQQHNNERNPELIDHNKLQTDSNPDLKHSSSSKSKDKMPTKSPGFHVLSSNSLKFFKKRGKLKTNENSVKSPNSQTHVDHLSPVHPEISATISKSDESENMDSLGNLPFSDLKYSGLKISSNVIDHSVPNNQLKEINLNNFNKLQKIDLSHNLLVNIKLKCLSLTTLIANSNKLSQIDFSIFNKQNLSIDFSNNNIIKFKAINHNNIFKLNLSNNQLSKINGEQMNNFINLKFIDLSNNPLSCFCNESRSFIDWIIQHKSLIVNSENTFCKTPMKQSIFDVKCPQSSTKFSSISTKSSKKISSMSTKSSTKISSMSTKSSTKISSMSTKSSTKISSTSMNNSTSDNSSSTVHTSLTKTSSTSSHSSTSTNKSSTTNHNKKKEAWKIVLAVIIPLAALLVIVACYCWFCRRKNKYQRLDR